MSALTSCSTTTTTGPTRKMGRRSPSSVQIWNPRPTTHISALYPEIMSMIFSYLDVTSKGRVSQVCSSWRESAYRKSVWRGVEAKLHLKPKSHCPTLFSSLLKRGIKKVQVHKSVILMPTKNSAPISSRTFVPLTIPLL